MSCDSTRGPFVRFSLFYLIFFGKDAALIRPNCCARLPLKALLARLVNSIPLSVSPSGFEKAGVKNSQPRGCRLPRPMFKPDWGKSCHQVMILLVWVWLLPNLSLNFFYFCILLVPYAVFSKQCPPPIHRCCERHSAIFLDFFEHVGQWLAKINSPVFCGFCRNMAGKTRRSGNKRHVSQVNQKMITSSTKGREFRAKPRGVFQLGGRDEKTLRWCSCEGGRDIASDKYLLVVSDWAFFWSRVSFFMVESNILTCLDLLSLIGIHLDVWHVSVTDKPKIISIWQPGMRRHILKNCFFEWFYPHVLSRCGSYTRPWPELMLATHSEVLSPILGAPFAPTMNRRVLAKSKAWLPGLFGQILLFYGFWSI